MTEYQTPERVKIPDNAIAQVGQLRQQFVGAQDRLIMFLNGLTVGMGLIGDWQMDFDRNELVRIIEEPI